LIIHQIAKMTDYLPLIKFGAKLGASLFAGTTLYCSLIEHPAMLECGTKSAADHWNVSDKICKNIFNS
jgi:hypothetical protein